MKNKNHNIRFNMEKEDECRAWELLHSKEIRQMSKSQNKFVIEAVNDYYDRRVKAAHDPYLETREKEDAFAGRICGKLLRRLSAVVIVEKKVVSNLPALFGMYMAQMQAFSLSVPMGAYPAVQGGMVYGNMPVSGTGGGNAVMGGAVSNPADTAVQSGETVTERSAEPPDNDLIDFDAF